MAIQPPPALATQNAATSAPTSAGAAAARVRPLPKSFLWGVASAGFQSEGSSPDSNWTRYVKASKTMDPVGTSVDFRHRYAADIERARKLGVKVYRISIEWARIEPSAGHYRASAWQYYDRVIRTIRKNGMRPMLTLDHWVYPGWEVDKGGWSRDGMVGDWVANAKKVVQRYAKYHPMWVTFNEPVFSMVQELQNEGLPPTELVSFLSRLVRAHEQIYDDIHRVQPKAMVTSNVAYIPTVETILDALFLDRVRTKLDYIGIDYYYPVSLGNITGLPGTLGAFTNTPWTAALSADGIYYVLRHYAQQFPHKPLYVVENGMPTENGKPRADGYDRADQLRDTIYWVQRAHDDGMNVIGYNYWSLTDNYEWGSYTPRFGLYRVNVLHDPKLVRHPTDAVPAYRAITAHDGVAASYKPTRKPDFCSLVDGLSSCLSPVH